MKTDLEGTHYEGCYVERTKGTHYGDTQRGDIYSNALRVKHYVKRNTGTHGGEYATHGTGFLPVAVTLLSKL